MLIGIQRGNDIIVGEHTKLFPTVSFPLTGPTDSFLASNNAKKVNNFKTYNSATEKLVGCDPYIEGDWVYVVRVENRTQEEIASDLVSKAAQMRGRRDQALKSTDWMVIRAQETGEALDTAWATYRQALRDLPEQQGFPNVDFPVDPDTQARIDAGSGPV